MTKIMIMAVPPVGKRDHKINITKRRIFKEGLELKLMLSKILSKSMLKDLNLMEMKIIILTT